MATPPTVEKIIEHHLSQNTGQKITPHLIVGIVALMSQNIRSAGLLKEQPAPANSEPAQ